MMKSEKIRIRKETSVACYKMAYGNHGIGREDRESGKFGFNTNMVSP